MDDGLRVPGAPDGMAAFPGDNGRTILVRNHEIFQEGPTFGAFGGQNELLSKVDITKLYDTGGMSRPALGGTTTLVYDPRERRIERQFLSLAGTVRNCSGGPTPWGSWLSCEETVQSVSPAFEQDHGYVFEVPASAEMRLTPAVPIRGMGRFQHEGAAVDPVSGCVYLTEDRGGNGLLQPKDQGLGLLYRFVPHRPGSLAAGGRLQALKIRDLPAADTTNWTGTRFTPGPFFSVSWVDLRDVEAPKDDLRHQGRSLGAAGFTRGEGIWAAAGAIYFCCTDGGAAGKGQVWRYRPGAREGSGDEVKDSGRLELFIEPNASPLLENCDNLTIAPWGDLILCEDGPGSNGLVGVTPEGRLYPLAQNSLNDSELAGAAFSADGSTLFVNLFRPGMTLAIRGPWPVRSTAPAH